MDTKEKYIKLKKDGKNVLTIFNELIENNSPMNSVVKLRELFPELTLIEAKEILILSETNYKDLDDYQKDLLNQLKNDIRFLRIALKAILFYARTLI
ncbi:hypothetical protein LF887_15640 [Chryseobacterium sp. MEBOG06]|uniref:hypothetical protein n=1 Tax=Chryseobacterium sp. MEBOG06 TaxID=2879938 RepID=UPI001F1AD861|nr:hypothetical protein [Chryseobacterium sp. MEBOG06]UKB82437.1 hypothetical protein LF887_15640 [Chryseobacterium sp. MEBOG06]